MNTESRFVAVDPKSGRHLRPATIREAVAYLTQPGRPVMRRAILVGAVLIDEQTGYGSNHDQGVSD